MISPGSPQFAMQNTSSHLEFDGGRGHTREFDHFPCPGVRTVNFAPFFLCGRIHVVPDPG